MSNKKKCPDCGGTPGKGRHAMGDTCDTCYDTREEQRENMKEQSPESTIKRGGVKPAPSTPESNITPSSQKSKKCGTCRGGETIPVYPPGPQGLPDRAPRPVCCKKEYREFLIRIDLGRQLQRKHDLLLEERALMREAMSRLAARDKEIERLQQENYGLAELAGWNQDERGLP